MKIKDGRIIYEYVLNKFEVNELKNAGLTEDEIITFLDDIIFRYAHPEYIDFERIRN